MTHGTADQQVPRCEAAQAMKQMKEAGVCVEWLEVHGKGHQMLDGETETEAVMKFMDQHMHLRNVEMEEMSDVIPVDPSQIQQVSHKN